MIDVHAEYPRLEKGQLFAVDMFPVNSKHANPRPGNQVRVPEFNERISFVPVRAGTTTPPELMHRYTRTDVAEDESDIDPELQTASLLVYGHDSEPTFIQDKLVETMHTLLEIDEHSTLVDPFFASHIDERISARVDQLRTEAEQEATTISQYLLERKLLVVGYDKNTVPPVSSDESSVFFAGRLVGVTVAIDKEEDRVGFDTVVSTPTGLGRMPEGFRFPRGIYAPRSHKKTV